MGGIFNKLYRSALKLARNNEDLNQNENSPWKFTNFVHDISRSTTLSYNKSTFVRQKKEKHSDFSPLNLQMARLIIIYEK